jgi:hypothetical protein
VYHNNRHNYTQLYTIIHNYTQLYTIIHNYTQLYTIYCIYTHIPLLIRRLYNTYQGSLKAAQLALKLSQAALEGSQEETAVGVRECARLRDEVEACQV